MNKIMTAIAGVLFSGIAAAECPVVGNYTVTGHSANHATCTYTSNKVIKLPFPPTHRNICPRFILTDPHYRVSSACRHDIRVIRCVCRIAHN